MIIIEGTNGHLRHNETWWLIDDVAKVDEEKRSLCRVWNKSRTVKN